MFNSFYVFHFVFMFMVDCIVVSMQAFKLFCLPYDVKLYLGSLHLWEDIYIETHSYDVMWSFTVY